MLRDVKDDPDAGHHALAVTEFLRASFRRINSGPSILGDLLSSGLGVQGMLWATSPACTELETHVLDWLVGMMGLPRSVPVCVARVAASSSTRRRTRALCALLAARERSSQYATNVHGVSAG